MYIRIQDNTIRFRISMTEANDLLANKSLEQKTLLSAGKPFICRIVSTDSNSQFEFNDASLQMDLKINRQSIEKEITGRPSKLGIVFKKTIEHEPLIISLEIDIKRRKPS